MKYWWRRWRWRKIDYSFESYSGSGSDLEELGDDEEDDDSDLSEGGGEEVLGDFISDEDDSEDVYIESELDNESGNNGLLFNSVFFVINGKCYENEMLLKLMEKLFSY